MADKNYPQVIPMLNYEDGPAAMRLLQKALAAGGERLSSQVYDALSAVDTETESRILRELKQVMRERTSLVISHRVSTVQDADLIVALRDGRILETGTHEELLARGGFYAELYNSQFERRAEAEPVVAYA